MLSIGAPLTLASTFTVNLTVTLLSFATATFHLTTPPDSAPPLSADTNLVCAGILSVIVAFTSFPVVFL